MNIINYIIFIYGEIKVIIQRGINMDLYNKFKLNMERYSGCTDILYNIYGLDGNEEYEAIILALSWKPEKIFKNFQDYY
jgi:hypothetical protein